MSDTRWWLFHSGYPGSALFYTVGVVESNVRVERNQKTSQRQHASYRSVASAHRSTIVSHRRDALNVISVCLADLHNSAFFAELSAFSKRKRQRCIWCSQDGEASCQFTSGLSLRWRSQHRDYGRHSIVVDSCIRYDVIALLSASGITNTILYKEVFGLNRP